MPDGWETLHGLDPLVNDAALDSDSDGLTNVSEYQRGSDPQNSDTDGDGLTDGAEVNTHGANPLNADSDEDGLNDGAEVSIYSTSPVNADSDGDGVQDGSEVACGMNPMNPDTDGDGVPDSRDITSDGLVLVTVTNQLPEYYAQVSTGTGNPEYEATVTFVPLLPSNTVRIVNAVVDGQIDDAFKINGVQYGWTWGIKPFHENITSALPDSTNGIFDIEIYDYVDPGWSGNGVSITGTCVMDCLVAIKVELDSVSSADFIGNEASGTKVYTTAKGSGNVVIQLKSSPSGVSLPSGFVSWAGGSVGNDQLQQIVSKSSLIEAGEDVVATVCGSDVFHGRVYVFKGPPVASGVDIDTTVTRDDSMATPFGLTDRSKAWSPSETYDVYYENAEWGFVLEKVAYEIKWGINNGGRTDVPDGTANPFPLGMGMPPGSTEPQKKTQAKSDLIPDATGRAPRTLYWASALTAQHEQFHVSDWRDNYYNPKSQEAETWIESQKDTVTLSKLIPVNVLNAKKSAFHDKLIEKTDEAQAAYSPDKETRAYADGKDEYQALADSILP